MKIIIYGISGRMGNHVYNMAVERGIEVVCGIDRYLNKLDIVTYPSLSQFPGKADVIIDFSGTQSLDDVLPYAARTKTALVLAATGYTDEQTARIQQAAQNTPILKSANMSLGINLVTKLIKTAYEALGERYDIEIIEKHHNQKIDSPSGTALLLADSVNELAQREYIYGREGNVGKRGNEIGIHAIRGGTIVGEHDVVFAGDDEIITISHSALSRKIFANGALRAAEFLLTKKSGLYSLQDIIG